ncbi:MAG: DUF1616 domain-containing protein [Candidatus Bathyarchaeota archaeon]|nr:MAG: DUF1616 domain-containing protein [Candidatus Bathyarchaeota archaeon]
MNLEGYRDLFLVGGLTAVLIVALPGLSVVVPIQRSQERYSELWLLGPERIPPNSPLNVTAEVAQGPIHISVGNYMGSSMLYTVHVKLSNHTQPTPNTANAEVDSASPMYEFQFLLADRETWETSLTFIIEDASFEEDYSSVSRISINDYSFSVDLDSSWDTQHKGFYYHLLVELGTYSENLHNFQHHTLFAGIWLNVTG